ncbi:MAG: M56 family metallopeptidase [Bacteroidota bacterium]|nr:M56 family metallopeptidase [Bacteroidota bacterium]
MSAIFHSAFLEALGFAIANSLWQMALIWFLYSIITFIGKPSATNEFRWAVAAQLAGFTWFICTLQFYYFKYLEVVAIPSNTQNTFFEVVIPSSPNSFHSILLKGIVYVEKMLPFLSFAYLLLLTFLLIRWGLMYNKTQALRRSGLSEAGTYWQEFISNIAEQLQISRRIQLFISQHIKSPMTIGFLKPIILVPLASLNKLSTEQLEAVLLHEMAHIKRYDYVLNIVLSVIEMLLFFNPFTQLLKKQIHSERENACDDWVLQFQYQPAMYAEALLQIAYASKETQAQHLSMMAVPKNGDLVMRVKRMIGVHEHSFNYTSQLLSLLLITIVLCSVTWLKPQKKEVYARAHQQTRTIVIEPVTAKVNNPFFNPVFFLQKPLQEAINNQITQAVGTRVQKEKNQTIEHAVWETIPPIAIKEIEKLDVAKIQKEVDQQIQHFEVPKPISLPSLLMIDSNDLVKLPLPLNIMKPAEWRNVKADISKAKADMQQVFLQQQKELALSNQQVKESIRKAFEELKRADIPLINKTNILNQLIAAQANIDRNLTAKNAEQFKKQKQQLILAESRLKKLDSLLTTIPDYDPYHYKTYEVATTDAPIKLSHAVFTAPVIVYQNVNPVKEDKQKKEITIIKHKNAITVTITKEKNETTDDATNIEIEISDN